MAKVYDGKIVKCPHCGKYIEYSSNDIYTRVQSYGLVSYAGETYNAHFITCPNCKREIEVYDR